jgi:hypothetical protein
MFPGRGPTAHPDIASLSRATGIGTARQKLHQRYGIDHGLCSQVLADAARGGQAVVKVVARRWV